MKNNYLPTKIACYTGYLVQAIINNLAPLFYVVFQNEFGISYTKISWLIMVNFLSQLVVDIVSIKVVAKIGYRLSVIFAHIFSCVGLVLLGVLPRALENSYVGLVIPIVVYAIGSGLIEVLISPIIEMLPLNNKSGEMSLLHSFYCWGQMLVVLITTLAIKAIGSENWIYMPIVWAIVPLINMFAFTKVEIIQPEENTDSFAGVKKLFKSPIFIVSAVVMFCSGASEITMAQWASTFAEKSLGVDKLTGDLLGPCLFAALMGSCRVIYGLIGDRISGRKILTCSAALCVCAYMLTTLSHNPMLSLAGCGLCGVSVAVMWPGTLSLTAKAFPDGGTALFAMLAVFGDLGCAFGPWISGIISDLAGKTSAITMEPLKFGLLMSCIFPITIILFLNVRKRKAS